MFISSNGENCDSMDAKAKIDRVVYVVICRHMMIENGWHSQYCYGALGTKFLFADIGIGDMPKRRKF